MGGAGERPGLAGEVADVAHPHTDLLRHLARQALLERLARLGEAGQGAVHPGGEMRAAREKNLIFSFDQSHDCCICRTPAQVTFILDALSLRQQFGIEASSAQHATYPAHRLTNTLKEGLTGILNEMPTIGNLLGIRQPSCLAGAARSG